jgi:dTMP kinase
VRVHTTTGVFVCFEGGDGSGKSTQARALVARLSDRGYPTRLTFEPGDTAVGKQVRSIVLDPATGDLSDRTEMLLYAADKAEHVDTVVLPGLERGEVVVTDRYVDSTLAYQGAGRVLDLADVERVARWATRDLRPHLTVVLDLEPEHGLGRFAERDRIEGEAPEFFVRVREAFLTLAAADPEHYLVIDASRPADEIAEVVATRVEPLLAQAAGPR